MMKNNQNEYNNLKELLDESKADISSYVEKRLMLAKLGIYEKVASSFSYIIYSLIVCIFAVVLFILVFLGLGLFIGEQLGNYSLGFGSLTLFLIFVFIIVIINQRKIRKILANLTIRTIQKIQKNED